MSDHEEVRQANRGFYDAFETLEVEQMERVWLQEPHIVYPPRMASAVRMGSDHAQLGADFRLHLRNEIRYFGNPDHGAGRFGGSGGAGKPHPARLRRHHQVHGPCHQRFRALRRRMEDGPASWLAGGDAGRRTADAIIPDSAQAAVWPT